MGWGPLRSPWGFSLTSLTRWRNSSFSVETLAVALVILALCSCVAGEVDERCGDPYGRPGVSRLVPSSLETVLTALLNALAQCPSGGILVSERTRGTRGRNAPRPTLRRRLPRLAWSSPPGRRLRRTTRDSWSQRAAVAGPVLPIARRGVLRLGTGR